MKNIRVKNIFEMYLEVVATDEDVNNVVGLDAQLLPVVKGVAESRNNILQTFYPKIFDY
jgi:hypothetical protein